MTLEQRVSQLEKEMGDLKRQPENQPRRISISISAFNFDNPNIDPNNMSDKQIQQFTGYLDQMIEEDRFHITIPWG